jgi:hypothetical protein
MQRNDRRPLTFVAPDGVVQAGHHAGVAAKDGVAVVVQPQGLSAIGTAQMFAQCHDGVFLPGARAAIGSDHLESVAMRMHRIPHHRGVG